MSHYVSASVVFLTKCVNEQRWNHNHYGFLKGILHFLGQSFCYFDKPNLLPNLCDFPVFSKNRLFWWDVTNMIPLQTIARAEIVAERVRECISIKGVAIQ